MNPYDKILLKYIDLITHLIQVEDLKLKEKAVRRLLVAFSFLDDEDIEGMEE